MPEGLAPAVSSASSAIDLKVGMGRTGTKTMGRGVIHVSVTLCNQLFPTDDRLELHSCIRVDYGCGCENLCLHKVGVVIYVDPLTALGL